MKQTITLLAAILLTLVLDAQDCAGYYYLTDNSSFIMTTYDRKEKESGVITYKISNVSKDGNTTTADFNSEAVDAKGKTISKGSGKYKCSNGIIYVDARVSLPSEQMEAYKNMDVKADEVYLEYPANMTIGQDLADGNFKMTISKDGSTFSNVTFKQVNRKVESKETVTTPAGTWECFRITSEGQFKASIGDSGIGIPFNFKSTEWFAPGFGIVKTETATKTGKLAGSSMITSVTK
jgi:DUF3108-like